MLGLAIGQEQVADAVLKPPALGARVHGGILGTSGRREPRQRLGGGPAGTSAESATPVSAATRAAHAV
jgi:hypothetical protein